MNRDGSTHIRLLEYTVAYDWLSRDHFFFKKQYKLLASVGG